MLTVGVRVVRFMALLMGSAPPYRQAASAWLARLTAVHDPTCRICAALTPYPTVTIIPAQIAKPNLSATRYRMGHMTQPPVRSQPSKPSHRRLRVASIAALLALAATGPALAQGWPWNWGWGQQQQPPQPREPVYRGPPGQQPQQYPPGQINPQQGYPQQQGAMPGGRSPLCLQLEQRLAQEVNRGSQSRDVLPKLEADIRQTDRAYQQGEAQLQRNDCYEYFLFSKTLRRTRACVDLAGQVEAARRRLTDLEAQRQQFTSSGSRSYQDDIIRELARNGCGATYQQHAARINPNPFSAIWQDEDSGGGYNGGQFGSLPFATYRTICVRLCDGYYFPVSFSTLPNHFDRDANECQSKCAAPAELYYHQNPGGAVEQAMSYKGQQPYTALKSAFRYRKEFIQGCSCKQAEYVPQQGAPPDKRADAAPMPAPVQQPRR